MPREAIQVMQQINGRMDIGANRNPSRGVLIAVAGAPNCLVSGQVRKVTGLKVDDEVVIGVRPEDIEIVSATASEAPAGMIGGVAHAALFSGDHIEYQVEVDGQSVVAIYGSRHMPVPEGGKVWLKLRTEGHCAWPVTSP